MAQTAEDLLIRIDATTEQLRRELRRADQAVAQTAGKIDRDLRRVDSAFAKIDGAISLTAKGLGALGLAFGAAEVVQFASRSLAAAEDIGRTAKALGATTAAVQELNYAFSRFGADSNDVSDALNTLADRAQDAISGTKSMQEDFALLGIGVDELRGKRPDELFDLFAAAVQRTTDVQARNAAVVRNLGDDLGRKLLPMLVAAKGGYQDMRQEARDLGLVLSDEIIDNAAQIRADFDKTSRILSTSFMAALNAAAPLLLQMARSTTEIATRFRWGFSDEGDLYGRLSDVVEEYQELEAKLAHDAKRPIIWRMLPDEVEETKQRIAELKEEANQLSLAIDKLGEEKPGPITLPTLSVAGAAINPEAEKATKKLAEDYAKLEASLQRQIALTGAVGDATALRYNLEHGPLKNITAAQKEYLLQLARAADLAAVDADGTNERIELYKDLEVQMVETTFAAEKTNQKTKEVLTDWQKFADTAAERIQGTLGDELYSVLDGKFESIGESFKNLLKRMVAEAMAADLMRSMFGSDGSIGGSDGWVGAAVNWMMTANADGNAFAGGRVVPFARGGVVGSPTLFPMAGSQTGLMGEAGPEAIMPLKRGRDGKLGVVAQGGGQGITIAPVINVDARGADSQAAQNIRNSMRELKDTIVSTVTENIARNGQIRQALGR